MVVVMPTVRALDFTPSFIETEVEGGVTNREVVLKDGSVNVVYCPPASWQAVAGERRIRFYPPGVSLADLTIESDTADHCSAPLRRRSIFTWRWERPR